MVQESPELASFKRKAGQLDKEMRYMDEVHTTPTPSSAYCAALALCPTDAPLMPLSLCRASTLVPSSASSRA